MRPIFLLTNDDIPPMLLLLKRKKKSLLTSLHFSFLPYINFVLQMHPFNEFHHIYHPNPIFQY